MSYRKIPARASHSWPVPLQGEPFSLVTFLLGLAKESNPAALADGSSALAYRRARRESFPCRSDASRDRAVATAGVLFKQVQSFRPLRGQVTFFC